MPYKKLRYVTSLVKIVTSCHIGHAGWLVDEGLMSHQHTVGHFVYESSRQHFL